ncbi:hypothetical protein ILUMI_09429 [Ignelater luminosus]|uniref:Chitin-binding type-2 domain-containing protein n=1 Tax=Ignelater luminosus TaxID=2038154 RepID=A0A8K0GF23_IGNLU|nr:hypothetical protein ILUMI_09429 [Ignelater luminosus]
MIPIVTLFILLAISKCTNADFYHPQCTSFGLSCLDCYTQKFCFGSSIWYNSSCQQGATDKNIYCHPNTDLCTSVPPTACALSGFRCPQPDGIFPDISGCSKYLKCKNNTSTLFSCPSDYIYSQKLGKCVFQLEKSDCVEITCVGITNGEYTYPNDPQLYYQCSTGMPKLLSCPENFVYDLTLKKCQTICKQVGLIANPKNCSEFISCEVSGSSLIPVRKNCRNGYGFNPVQNECQRDLDRLCFEISTFNNTFVSAPLIPSFIKGVIIVVVDLVTSFGINFPFLIFMGVPQEFLSTTLLTGTYIIINNFRLPSKLLSSLIRIILNFIPSEARNPIQLALSLIFGNSWLN